MSPCQEVKNHSKLLDSARSGTVEVSAAKSRILISNLRMWCRRSPRLSRLFVPGADSLQASIVTCNSRDRLTDFRVDSTMMKDPTCLRPDSHMLGVEGLVISIISGNICGASTLFLQGPFYHFNCTRRISLARWLLITCQAWIGYVAVL
jgi:hypothetical protein